MNAKLSSALIAATAIAAVALCGPARAQAPSRAPAHDSSRNAPSRVVHYSAVELSTPAGTRALYHRIQVAAWQVCREMFTGPVGIAITQCRSTLVDAAVQQVHSPALAALHNGKQPALLTTARLDLRSR